VGAGEEKGSEMKHRKIETKHSEMKHRMTTLSARCKKRRVAAQQGRIRLVFHILFVLEISFFLFVLDVFFCPVLWAQRFSSKI